MSSQITVIISDVHLGSSHFSRGKFKSFLDSLPKGTRLILNGDTLDRAERPLPEPDREIMKRLLPGNPDLETVWIEGNHDSAEVMKKNWRLPMHPSFRLNEPAATLVLHGVCFDTLGSGLRHGVRLFRAMHQARTNLGLTSIHFAEYAKRWGLPYRLMRTIVRRNAIRHARLNSADTVVCGHVHQGEDIEIEGIRYINTGTWIGEETCYLEIRDGKMRLRRWQGSRRA